MQEKGNTSFTKAGLLHLDGFESVRPIFHHKKPLSVRIAVFHGVTELNLYLETRISVTTKRKTLEPQSLLYIPVCRKVASFVCELNIYQMGIQFTHQETRIILSFFHNSFQLAIW